MSGHCADCRKWLTQRVTDYESGERIINYASPEGMGKCELLTIEVPAAFGCVQFDEGHEHIEIMGKKTGAPWHHSKWGTCPDCLGKGLVPPHDPQIACKRCARTGRVLFYDDGYVGEEQTRRHPNEEVKGPPPPPACESCGAHVGREWKACPHCGNRIRQPDDPVRVGSIEAMGTGQQGNTI